VFLACKGNANIGLTGKCFRFSISLQNRLKWAKPSHAAVPLTHTN
jgi:hypothetical protein